MEERFQRNFLKWHTQLLCQVTNWAISKLPFPSGSKRVFVQNQSDVSGYPYGSLFLQIQVIFLWKVFTRTRFGTDNSEMATLRSKVSVGKQKAGFSVHCPRKIAFIGLFLIPNPTEQLHTKASKWLVTSPRNKPAPKKLYERKKR